MKTRGELEAEIGRAIVRFEVEFMGRGPLETKVFLVEDLVVVRLKNVLTPAEHKLASVEDPSRGRDLVKSARHSLLELGRPLLEAVLHDILGVRVISLHTDISTRTGERIIVFTLERIPATR